jgi:hypothetical protein
MPDYDFHTLSPYDFELISRDIIQARDNIVLESFRTGRDDGIDFRYCPSEDQKIIVQCKHYRGTSVSGLIRSLKKEAQKLIKLSPSRYIIVTSLPLTPANKASIQKLFASNVLKAEDIITAEDLNNLLGMFPQIETSHHKLWLASIPVMQKVLHNAEHTRAADEIERISENIKRYVQSDAYSKAAEILDKENFVIITGQPGVGKTTLAEMLIYAYAKENFRLVVINANIEEARRIYTPGARQIFYYDDFLGATFLGEQHTFLQANHDRDLLKFIDMVRRSKTAKLILTTREHILSQALRLSERLSMENILDSKCVIEMSSYTRLQKARILYNHIYFSELPKEYIASLLTEKFYMHIIDHAKFNPRIIEWLSSYQRIKTTQPAHFRAFVMKLLEDPAQFWLYAYNEQLSESARSMLLAIHSLGPSASVGDVFQVFDELNRHRARKYHFAIKPEDSKQALKEICDSFVSSENARITYINPSVADLMNRVIRDVPDNGLDIIYSAQKFSQLLQIWSIADSDGGEILRESICRNIIEITPILSRLIERPMFEKRGNKVVSHDTSFDQRAICLLGIAELSQTTAMSLPLTLTLEKTLAHVTGGYLSVRDGLSVYDELVESEFAKAVLGSEFFDQFRATLLEALLKSPTSDDLFVMVQYLETNDDCPGDEALVRVALENYIERRFSHELRECSASGEIIDFRETMEFIGVSLGQDLSEEMQRIEERQEAIQQMEEELTDEFEGLRSSMRANERELSDEVTSMFETLAVNLGRA